MRLEDVTAKIRPRARWESIDLGCAMARRSYGKILLAWLVCVWPIWILGVIGLGYMSEEGWHLFWSTLWVWLTLGLAGRLPLYVMSRELFGEEVTAWAVIKRSPQLFFKGFLHGIVSRFSMSRGLSMPVSQLEGLKGQAYRSRVNLLLRNGGDGATQAVLVCNMMLLVTSLACWFFIMMILQFYGQSDLFETFFEDVYAHGGDHAVAWLFFLFYCISVTLVEPLFVGSGFAMYVNSRTLTEGWDIELSFKRLSERLRRNFHTKGVSILFVFCGLSLFSMSEVSAETAKERAGRILNQEEYTIHQRQEKTYKSKSSSSSSSSSAPKSVTSAASGVGGVFEGISLFVFWSLVLILLGLIVWVILKNRHALDKTNSLEEVDDVPPVKSVMGMDVTLESLPKALSEEAREAWLRGEHQLALSLLYRGAISWMVHQGRIAIVESDTENDCVQRVLEKQMPDGKGSFFKGVTDAWIQLAYGKHLPPEAEVLEMCNQWPFNQEGGAR